MTLDEALKTLNIEDYKERILNSNSHGELLHLLDYFNLAKLDNVEWFREWFEAIVKYAEKNWKRPASVYQHIAKILIEHMESVKEKKHE